MSSWLRYLKLKDNILGQPIQYLQVGPIKKLKIYIFKFKSAPKIWLKICINIALVLSFVVWKISVEHWGKTRWSSNCGNFTGLRKFFGGEAVWIVLLFPFFFLIQGHPTKEEDVIFCKGAVKFLKLGALAAIFWIVSMPRFEEKWRALFLWKEKATGEAWRGGAIWSYNKQVQHV